MTALRRGETDNCVMCRGESSCILPIAPAAVHTNPTGSRLAIRHFTEYLEQFPDDLEVRWLLNLAHMTLGEYPAKVDPRFLISLDRFLKSEFDIGKFRDIGHLAGVNRFNQAGGAIMEDFDNDGLLDLVVTSFDPTEPMAFYRNKGDGTFEDRTEAAGLTDQLGGMNCVQTDYNNDGRMDIFIPRGAWLPFPMRPSLLRNNGDGTFTDVTQEAGLLDPVNSTHCVAGPITTTTAGSTCSSCCESQPNRLYHNRGDGTFEEVAAKAGVAGDGRPLLQGCRPGSTTTTTVIPTCSSTICSGDRAAVSTTTATAPSPTSPRRWASTGRTMGFSCWAWDYDNDGWLDIFATCYDRSLERRGQGPAGPAAQPTIQPALSQPERQGLRGRDQGSRPGHGLRDHGEQLRRLRQRRLPRLVPGHRRPEPGHPGPQPHVQERRRQALRRDHRAPRAPATSRRGTAWPAATGTATATSTSSSRWAAPSNGDRYHNILFQNPGQGNHWLTVKLVGKKTNRAAIGARIKVVTAGEKPLTIHRHVSSGSSFGANPLQQTIGLAKAERVAVLEIHWPTSGTTQVFRDIAANQAIEVTELATPTGLPWKPVSAQNERRPVGP